MGILDGVVGQILDVAKPFIPMVTGAVSAYGAYKGQEAANATNVALAEGNRDWSADQARINRQFQQESAATAMDFESTQAAINREFQQGSADKAMDFSAGQAQRQMDFQREMVGQQMGFQERMANSTYQRAVADLSKAGLNPMLAYSQGGAPAPTGANATGASGSGSSASGSTASGKSASGSTPQNFLARVENAVAPALNSGNMAAKVSAEIQNAQAQNANIKANNDKIKEETELLKWQRGLVMQQQQTSSSSAGLIEATRRRVEREAERVEEEIKNIRSRTDLNHYDLDKLRPLEARLMELNAMLLNYELPGAENRSSAAGTWWGKNISPYIQDFSGIGRGAGGLGLRLRR